MPDIYQTRELPEEERRLIAAMEERGVEMIADSGSEYARIKEIVERRLPNDIADEFKGER